VNDGAEATKSGYVIAVVISTITGAVTSIYVETSIAMVVPWQLTHSHPL